MGIINYLPLKKIIKDPSKGLSDEVIEMNRKNHIYIRIDMPDCTTVNIPQNHLKKIDNSKNWNQNIITNP